MEELPADLKAFLVNHPFLQLAEAKKIKCTLNGHEFPCNLTEVKNFTEGKKYLKLSATAQFNYSQYEPHVVPSSKQPHHLFCKLTLKHINRLPHHVLRHVNGKRFKRALEKYEECVRQGVAYVPVQLRQKKPRDSGGEGEPRRHGNGHAHQGASWEPAGASEEEGSDSEDSMSDLYPPSMFSVNKSEAEEGTEKEPEDDFQTDDEEEKMDVDKQAPQKRKKVQGGVLQKKFKKRNWKRKGSKNSGLVKNGK